MVAAVASGAGRDGRVVLFAATPAGVYRSLDRGVSWELPGSGGGVPFAEALALSPSFAEDDTVFACGGETLYRSTDRGETWEPVLVGSRMFCVCAARGPAEGGLVVMAGTETDGLLRSDDGGRSWTGVNAGVMDLTAISLAVSPNFAQDRTSFAGAASALYRSRNGGLSWREVDTATDEPAVQCLAFSPAFAEDRLILAGTEADGLLRSTDGGSTWQRLAEAAGDNVTAIVFQTSGRGELDTPAVAVAGEDRVVVSRDGGASWETVSADLETVLGLSWLESAESAVLLAGTARQGLVRFESTGGGWIRGDGGPNVGLIAGLALSPAFASDHTVFAAGLQGGVRCSNDGGRTWALQSQGLEDAFVTGLTLSPGFAQDRTLYAATPAGVHTSTDAGVTWSQPSSLTQQVRAMAILPIHSTADTAGWRLVIAGDGGVLLASDDGARTWQSLGPGIAGCQIVSLAASPDYRRDRTLFVGTSSEGRGGAGGQTVLWRSTDGGSRWHRWLVEEGSRYILPLAVPPDHAINGLIFVGVGGLVLAPRRGMEQVRGGERRPIWQRVAPGRDVGAVTGLASVAGYGSTAPLFASTNAGMYVSRDGGNTFLPWSDGLRQRRLVAAVVSPGFGEDHFVLGVGVDGTIWRRRWEDLAGVAD
jgi:photosystem II stability/assembly factor-like uncharacterized protein